MARNSYANLYLTTMLEGVHDIFGEQIISKARYTELYTLAYKIANLRFQDNGRAGETLYRRLDNFLQTRSAGIVTKFHNDVGGIDLIQLLAKEWKEYSFKCKLLDSVSAYFNKWWVATCHEEPRNRNVTYHEIYQLAMEAWKSQFQGLKSRLAAAFGQCLETEDVPHEVLKNLTHFLAAMSSRPVSIDATSDNYQRSLFGKLKEFFEE